MKITTSICKDCIHFHHECSDDDSVCREHCFHKNKNIKERFYDETIIEVCTGLNE